MRLEAVLRPLLLVTALPLLIAMVGCGPEWEYVLHVTQGQLAVQGDVESVEDVLASGRLGQEEQHKLELIVQAREFAVNNMGLDAGDSYTTFYDTGGDPLAWNLSASYRDRLEAITASFPIVGTLPYIAFFDEGYLREVEQGLQERGYDTMTYEIDAYSTLGLFADPVRSTMLRRSPLSLADTIIHELLHNTIWRQNDADFNESLATFVGRQGAIDFLVAEFGEESGWPEFARAHYADVDVVNTFLADLYVELRAYYAQDLPPEELIAGREAVFQAARERFESEILPTLHFPEVQDYLLDLPTNNAWVLLHRRYNYDLAAFEAVYELEGGDWAATLEVFRAARDADGEPFAYLNAWVAERQAQAAAP